ncbi:catalase-like domain-containing protein [Massariosphaeria phaeospora]|uniref:Catalase-like domain-containing protein n=1 Tax=Massariosphaeria phaeospora TaxID=100035 RepID=A0A7C8I2Z2_9PLEO|nr:catalase-like domain-containing protein [Massariosphaeria phaeospora]
MPLSTDAKVLETSQGLVDTLRAAAGGAPKAFRPAHARGHLLTGTFTPTPTALALSKAPHFNNPSTPITVRFSSSTGLPEIPDTDPNANPRGIAIRFHLPLSSDGRRHHTDIIAHSTKYFPVRTGADFLAFLQAAGGPKDALPEFLGWHPETVRFLQDPKPSPVSFATQRFFGINAFKFVSQDGNEVVVRYRIEPSAGVQTLTAEETAAKEKNYLFDELSERLESGPFEFKLLAQVAEEGDVTNDATVLWPEDRKVVELGAIRVEQTLSEEESLKEQKQVIFDPIPRVEGVHVSDDPLLDVRASLYLLSGRQRREA